MKHLCTLSHFSVTETKELISLTPAKRLITPNCPTSINGQPVEMVESFKYLGIVLDNKLHFVHHITDIHKRCQQRPSAIRKLRALSAKPHLLLLLYQSIIEPILRYCATCYFTTLTLSNTNKLLEI